MLGSRLPIGPSRRIPLSDESYAFIGHISSKQVTIQISHKAEDDGLFIWAPLCPMCYFASLLHAVF